MQIETRRTARGLAQKEGTEMGKIRARDLADRQALGAREGEFGPRARRRRGYMKVPNAGTCITVNTIDARQKSQNG